MLHAKPWIIAMFSRGASTSARASAVLFVMHRVLSQHEWRAGVSRIKYV